MTENGNLLGKLGLRFFDDEKGFRFDVDNTDLLNEVTEKLDDVVIEMSDGSGTLAGLHTAALNKIIKTCKELTELEPAFLDGYAHWIGALYEQKKFEEAVEIGLPRLDECFKIISEIPKGRKRFKPNYYDLPNRPFYRLAYNVVLGLYGLERNAEASTIAKKMVKLWPNDNYGFRFLFDGLETE